MGGDWKILHRISGIPSSTFGNIGTHLFSISLFIIIYDGRHPPLCLRPSGFTEPNPIIRLFPGTSSILFPSFLLCPFSPELRTSRVYHTDQPGSKEPSRFRGFTPLQHCLFAPCQIQNHPATVSRKLFAINLHRIAHLLPWWAWFDPQDTCFCCMEARRQCNTHARMHS